MSNRHANYSFRQAVLSHDFNQMKTALANGADVNAPFNQDYPVIHYAVATRDLPLLSFLIENGADVNNPQDVTPLCKMFFYRDVESLSEIQIEIIDRLIQSGADVTLKTPDKRMIWEHIPLKFKPRLFQMIQKTNPAQEVLSKLVDTALEEALSARDMDSIIHWLDAGANANCAGKNKMRALHYAALIGDMELATFLLDHNADENAQNEFYHTALHTLIIGAEKFNPANRFRILSSSPYGLYHPVFYNRDSENINRLRNDNQDLWEYTLQFARLLLERGINPHIRDNWGQTADAYVLDWQNKSKLLELFDTVQPIKPVENFPLIQWNAAQKTKQEALSDLFSDAYRHRDFEKMKIAIQNGYDLNKSDNYGSILHHVVSNDDVEMASFLIANGADVNIQNSDGNTPLHQMNWLCVGYPEREQYPVYPNETRFQKLQRIIYEYKISIGHHYWPKPHHIALQEQPVELKQKHHDMVELLVRAGADLHVENNDGYTPLEHVPEKVLTRVFETIRNCYPTRNEKVENAIQNAADHALYFGMLLGKTDRIKYWVNAGANANLPNDTDVYRPVNYGAKELDVELVKLLANKNADMTFQNRYGTTAWHSLCQGAENTIGYMQELNRYLSNPYRYCINDAMQNDLYTLRHQGITDEDMDDMIKMMCNRTRQIAQTLLDAGVNPHLRNEQGKTGLHYVESWHVADTLIKTINTHQPPQHITTTTPPAQTNEGGRPRC